MRWGVKFLQHLMYFYEYSFCSLCCNIKAFFETPLYIQFIVAFVARTQNQMPNMSGVICMNVKSLKN